MASPAMGVTEDPIQATNGQVTPSSLSLAHSNGSGFHQTVDLTYEQANLSNYSDRANNPVLSNQKTRSWSSLLKNPPPSAGNQELCFIEPIFKNGILQLDEELIKEGAAEWEHKVVGFFLDKKLPFTMVKNVTQQKWNLDGEVEIALDGDLFYFTFNNEHDREAVIEEGSFFIAGKLFVIRNWSLEVEANKGAITKVPLWVKLFNVPKFFWNPKGLSFLASTIGKPICLDKVTEKRTMLNFARVCVDVDAKKALPTEIKAEIGENKVATITVDYPWKPRFCTICEVFGHSNESCGKHLNHRRIPPGNKHHTERQKWNAVKPHWRKETQQITTVADHRASAIVESEKFSVNKVTDNLKSSLVDFHSSNVANNKFSCLEALEHDDEARDKEEEVQAIKHRATDSEEEDGQTDKEEARESDSDKENGETVREEEELETEEEGDDSEEEEGECNFEAEEKEHYLQGLATGVNSEIPSIEEPNDNMTLDLVDVPDSKMDGVSSKDTQKMILSVEGEKTMVEENNQQVEDENALEVLDGNGQTSIDNNETIHFQLAELDDALVTNIYGVNFGSFNADFFSESLPSADWAGQLVDDPDWGIMMQFVGDVRKEAAVAFHDVGLSLEHIKIHRPSKSLKTKFNLAHWGNSSVVT